MITEKRKRWISVTHSPTITGGPSFSMRRFLLILTFLIALTLSNAQGQAKATTEAASPVRYALNVRVVPDARRIEVNGTMRFRANNAARPFVEFSLTDRMQDLQVKVLKPIASAGIAEIERARTEGSWLSQDGSINSDVVYRIRPDRPFPPGAEIELQFSYSGGGKMGVLFYLGPEVSFASAYGTTWYPQNSDHPTG